MNSTAPTTTPVTTRFSRFKRRVAAAGLVVAASVSLSACGNDGSHSDMSGMGGTDNTPTSAASPAGVETASNGDVFNAADVNFATMMIPHHAQALEMVDLTEGRTLSPQVQALADQIRNAQTPEIQQMSDWLSAWGKDVPDTSKGAMDGMHDMDTGDSSMPGMMSADDMTALKDASDADFEQMWLQMMIEHHTGAIEMAKTEQSDGSFADAITLAGSIIEGQQKEIDTMNGLVK